MESGAIPVVIDWQFGGYHNLMADFNLVPHGHAVRLHG